MTPLYQIKNLTIDLPLWGDRPYAVQNTCLDLYPKEILCIVGESGSGKSLLARSMMGLFPSKHVRASSGEILLNGENILEMSSDRLRSIRGEQVAMIFQEPMTALNPLLTIGDQIIEVINIHHPADGKDHVDQVLEMLDSVSLPSPREIYDAYPHQLSGGQRQRAMIAMALILEPKCLIADEPTTALDVTTQAQILKLIKELQKKHQTAVLFITHDIGIVAEIADRIAVMEAGQLVEIGIAKEILMKPKHPFTIKLLDSVPSIYPKNIEKEKYESRNALVVNGISKTFNTKKGIFKKSSRMVKALSNISFTLKEGQTLGIVGESGSGKSTIAKCIARLTEPDSGEIMIFNHNFLSLSGKPLRTFRKNVQLIFQDPYSSLDPRQKVGSLIMEGPLLHGESYKMAEKRMLNLLDTVGLDRKAANRFPNEFSGGQRQRIGIARSLALQPKLLIADEAVSALDVTVQAQILKLLKDIKEEFELTLVFITHDLRVAAQVCDFIMVMSKGEVVEYGSTKSIFNSPTHPYTRELFSAVPGCDFWLKHKMVQ